MRVAEKNFFHFTLSTRMTTIDRQCNSLPYASAQEIELFFCRMAQAGAIVQREAVWLPSSWNGRVSQNAQATSTPCNGTRSHNAVAL